MNPRGNITMQLNKMYTLTERRIVGSRATFCILFVLTVPYVEGWWRRLEPSWRTGLVRVWSPAVVQNVPRLMIIHKYQSCLSIYLQLVIRQYYFLIFNRQFPTHCAVNSKTPQLKLHRSLSTPLIVGQFLCFGCSKFRSDSSRLIIYCRGKEWMDLYLHSSLRLHGLRTRKFTITLPVKEGD